jgi:hypothetical protein
MEESLAEFSTDLTLVHCQVTSNPEASHSASVTVDGERRVGDVLLLQEVPMQTLARSSERPFFVALSVLATAYVFVGFAPTFYLQPWFNRPPLKPLVIFHGVLFTMWSVLMVSQSLLIRFRQYRFHRYSGMFGALIALLMIITGYMVIFGKPRPTIEARAFIFTPMLALALFGAFVATAIYWRRDGAIHKRLMFLSMLLIAAGVARAIRNAGFDALQDKTLLFTYGTLLLPLVAYDLIKLKRVHPATLWGAAILLLRHPLHQAIAYTDTWQGFAAWLTT